MCARSKNLLDRRIKGGIMKFRYHRGDLQDSLSTQFEFKGKKDLIHKIQEKFPYVNEDNIFCVPYGYDERIKEYVYLVQLKVSDGNFAVLGMTDCMIR